LSSAQPRDVERVSDLPLHVALLVDTSASMEASLGAVQAAAVRFFEQVLEGGDRGAVVTFSDRPRLVTPFTADPAALMLGLVGLTSENSTALHDSVVFALNYLQGIRGQRALLVLSDGADRQSRRTADDVLEYARHAGVTVYAIDPSGALSRQLSGSSRHLTRLADETGGRGFGLPSLDALAEVYATIERDLRSRYLLVYQSAGGDPDRFRQVEVQVRRPGLVARHMAGYYP
jgi:VWFA-related protein